MKNKNCFLIILVLGLTSFSMLANVQNDNAITSITVNKYSFTLNSVKVSDTLHTPVVNGYKVFFGIKTRRLFGSYGEYLTSDSQYVSPGFASGNNQTNSQFNNYYDFPGPHTAFWKVFQNDYSLGATAGSTENNHGNPVTTSASYTIPSGSGVIELVLWINLAFCNSALAGQCTYFDNSYQYFAMWSWSNGVTYGYSTLGTIYFYGSAVEQNCVYSCAGNYNTNGGIQINYQFNAP